MASTYTYSPLPSESHIRLLTLLPGTASDDLRVILESANLEPNDRPTFEALSYVWGSPEDPRQVKVGKDGRETISVTQNLDIALHQLRDPAKPRILWIDAICIDQANLPERSQQVARMGDLYTLATRVVVWLGLEADDSVLAMDTLYTLAAKVDVNWMGGSMTPSAEAKDEPHWADSSTRLPWDEEEIVAVERFIDRPWFQRLWVVQEVRLSNNKTIVVCGQKTMKWTDLADALLCLVYKLLKRGLKEKYAWQLRSFTNIFDPGYVYPLISLMQQTRRLKCVDARDRVYAIIHIIHESDKLLGINPDYTLSVDKVYADVTRRHIERYRVLDILSSCDLGSKKTSGPTWVPDWSNSRVSEDITNSNSAETAEADVEFRDKNILRVAGIACGTVTSAQTLSSEHNLSDLEEKILQVAPQDVLTSNYVTGCSLLEAFCGTLAGSNFPEHDPPHATAALREPATRDLRQFLESAVAGSMRDNRQFGHYLADVYLAGRGRSLFSTGDGHLGLAPDSVQTGDVVAVILGCRTPMLLRRTLNDQLMVVGEGFVYGLANGEAILGPLPENTEMLLRYNFDNDDPTLSGNYWAYRNKETGVDSWEDPRLSRFGLTSLGAGGKKGQDRKVTADMLKLAGTNIQYFDLV